MVSTIFLVNGVSMPEYNLASTTKAGEMGLAVLAYSRSVVLSCWAAWSGGAAGRAKLGLGFRTYYTSR